jgi:RNA polymerase sigma factor (sigma-70 family)
LEVAHLPRSAYSIACSHDVCLLRETENFSPCASGHATRLRTWSDEELAHIRIVLRRLTASRIQNDDDVEDLVQETLLTVAAKCPEMELEKGLLVWSMGVLRRKLGNYYRKKSRYTSLDDREFLVWKAWEERATERSPESLLLRSELQALVNRIVAGFPAMERRVMELFLAGRPTHEIADLLYPERYQNVVNRLHRGRRKLARRLACYGFMSRR